MVCVVSIKFISMEKMNVTNAVLLVIHSDIRDSVFIKRVSPTFQASYMTFIP